MYIFTGNVEICRFYMYTGWNEIHLLCISSGYINFNFRKLLQLCWVTVMCSIHLYQNKLEKTSEIFCISQGKEDLIYDGL